MTASEGEVLVIEGRTNSKKQAQYLQAFQCLVQESGYQVMRTELPARPGNPEERLKTSREVWGKILSRRWDMILVDGHRDEDTMDTLVRGLEFGDLDADRELRGKSIQTDLLVVGTCWSAELAPKLCRRVENGAHLMLWRNPSLFDHGFDVYPNAFRWVADGRPDPDAAATAYLLRGSRHIDLVRV